METAERNDSDSNSCVLSLPRKRRRRTYDEPKNYKSSSAAMHLSLAALLTIAAPNTAAATSQNTKHLRHRNLQYGSNPAQSPTYQVDLNKLPTQSLINLARLPTLSKKPSSNTDNINSTPSITKPTYKPPPKRHPYIASYSADTCTNDRAPETWEASSSSLTDCCTKSFGWRVEECVTIGARLEQERWNSITDDDDASSAETRYNYIPNWSGQTCSNDAPPPNDWIEQFTTLKECCTKNFNWILDDCLGDEAQGADDDTPVEYKYTPDMGARTCYNDKPPANDWVKQYTTLEECCGKNFEWVLNDCLGDLAIDLAGDDTFSEEDLKLNPWYPLFSKKKCLHHTDKDLAPDYMLKDIENEMFPTFKTCCQSNFPNHVKECKAASRLDTPPTRPPATHTGNTNVIVPVNFVKYYYPRYTENKCLLNGEEAPKYMKNDPITYLALTVEECCEVQFPLNTDDCLYHSGARYDPEEVFNEERWKDHYYPLFSTIGCINDNAYDEYMKDAPRNYFFTTTALCCSSDNFESGDYEMCLENSVNALASEDEPSEEEKEEVPTLTLHFGGRVYFQNVFIPSGNRANMIAVKNAILFSIESAFQASRYKVESTVAKNFDGIDLSSLRRLSSQEGVSRLLQNGQDDEPHGRELSKMQLFSFLISFTIVCTLACGKDGKDYGRQISLEIGEIFDDAIQDGSLFQTLKTSMDEQGLIGPFYSSSLHDGVLLYEKAVMDMNGNTFSPTPQPSTLEPSESPSLHPVTAYPTTRAPATFSPSKTMVTTTTGVYQFYPNFTLGTCMADGKHTRWEVNFYDTLDECCKFPWLEYNKCIQVAAAQSTSRPTTRPTIRPTKKSPTSKPPTTSPSKNPVTPYPTRAPVTSSPSKAGETSTTTTTSSSTTTTTITTPVITPAPVFLSPTEFPSNKPTLEPCDNYWHVSILVDEIQTCTNSLDYPVAWEMTPQLKAKMLLDTPKQCCEDNFPDKKCNIVYVCGGAGVIEPEPEPPGGNGGCDAPWHLSLEKGNACTNNDNVRPEWPEMMFHATGALCCMQHFKAECTLIEDCPVPSTKNDNPTPSPINDSGPSPDCPDINNPWHIATDGSSNTCVNDENYPAIWATDPNFKKINFFDTADLCCEKYFKNGECIRKDVCAKSVPPSLAPSHTTDSSNNDTESSDCAGANNPWHIATDGSKNTCTNNEDFPAAWASNPSLKAINFFDTADLCCDKYFKNAECIHRDICADPSPTPSPEDCAKSNPWHIATNGSKNTCTNSKDFPAAWESNPNLKATQLFDTPDLCCQKHFKNSECTQVDICTVPDSAPTSSDSGSGDCSSNSWHIATDGTSNTCVNDLNYPSLWDSNEHIRATQLFATPQLCCERQFSDGVCNTVDICTGEVKSNGYYPVFKWPGCTNDNDPPAYMKGDTSFFFATVESCCSSDNFEVTDYDLCIEKSVDSVTTTTTTTTTSSSQVATTTSSAQTSSQVASTTSSNIGTTVKQMESITLDWEDEAIPDIVSFEGIGKWSIDDTQPCCKTGLSIHSPKLLPGETSSMIIEYMVSSNDGAVSFSYNMGLGTFNFLIDGESKLSVATPGGGKLTFEEKLGPGVYTFTWEYVPPAIPNLPLSSVWVDNIKIG